MLNILCVDLPLPDAFGTFPDLYVLRYSCDIWPSLVLSFSLQPTFHGVDFENLPLFFRRNFLIIAHMAINFSPQYNISFGGMLNLFTTCEFCLHILTNPNTKLLDLS